MTVAWNYYTIGPTFPPTLCTFCKMPPGSCTKTCRFYVAPALSVLPCNECGLIENQHETYCGKWIAYEKRELK